MLAGIALWLTHSVLDMYGDAAHSTRVAMLPSAPELAGLIVLALLGAGAVAGLVRRWTRTAAERSDARLQIALPLFALAALGLPYLPIVPDVIPALRAFAGPIAFIIWFCVLGLVVIAAVAVFRSLRRTQARVPRSRLLGSATIFFFTLIVSGTAAMRLRDTLVYPSGDSPRYLTAMQSGFAQHSDAIHGVGLPLLAAPVFALSGYHGVVWMLVALTATIAAMMWRWTLAHTASPEAATLAWAAIFLSPPLLFTSIAVYPDIPAALAVVMALTWRSDPRHSVVSVSATLLRAGAASALVWLSLAYLPIAIAIVIVLCRRARGNRRAVLMLLAIFALSTAAWWLFTRGIEPAVGDPLAGIAGLLFDHEFGVLPYAPGLMLGLVGIWRMARARDGYTHSRGRELAVVFGSVLLAAAAAPIWWGGTAPPGRPLVAGLPLLGLPIAWMYGRTADSPVRRAGYQLLILVGVAFSLAMLFAQGGELITQDRDGSSRLLQWLTSLWPAWEAVPSIAAFGLVHALPLIALWLLAAVATAWVMDRTPVRSPGLAALIASVYVAAVAVLIAIAGPLVSRPASAWVLQPESRSRIPLLDSFDANARPYAIIYNRLTLARAATIPPLMTMAAAPGERPGGQPVRVLLNARYALPAGEYEVEIGGLRDDAGRRGSVALQVGRIGSPMIEWDADVPVGGVWRQSFSLPVDAEFVGFVASPPLDTATELRVRPISIVDKSRREANVHGMSFTVLSAVAFPTASVFFHDEDVYPERTGVWVHGESTASMTVAPQHPENGVTLRVHSGAKPNVVTFSTTTWGERVELVPQVPRDVEVPPPAKPGPFLLTVKTENSFVPAEVIPGNSDRRILGCWIEIHAPTQ